MRVVLTGAAGLTGGAVLQVLRLRGHHILAVVRRDPERIVEDDGVHVAVADCSNVDEMARLIESSDALVHVAGIHLGAGLATVAGLSRLHRLIVVSTASVYSKHRTQVGFYRQNEDALLERFPSATIVRPTMIYGSPRDRNVHHVVNFAAKYRFLPLVRGGASLLQPIHYQDLAEGLASLLDRGPSGILDAPGSNALTVRAAGETIFAALSIPARFVGVPLKPALGAARLIDHLRGSRLAERLERFDEDRSVDVSRFTAVTGVRPRSFEQGIRAEVIEMLGR